jgi:hypothetical protein
MQSNPIFSPLGVGLIIFLVLIGPLIFLFVTLVKNLFPAIYYCQWNNQHHWAWKKVAGTCIERSYCLYCKKVGEERTNHLWVWKKAEGACLEKSFCSRCKEAGAERPLPHEPGEWEKVENECLERKRCSLCNEIIEERVSHTWGDWEKVEGYELERKICIFCKALGSERVSSQKAYCEACNGTGQVVLGGWNSPTTCKVCGGTGVVQKYVEKPIDDNEVLPQNT